ncbi:MAG: PHP-associated domain-containing protein [Candidatus Limnocylindrales bacterium]
MSDRTLARPTSDASHAVHLGRADVHIHSAASDGVAGIDTILRYVQEETDLDVIAIADHERVDAALAAREMAASRGYRFEVVVGEEITTRGGHLLGLFLSRPVPPLRSLRWSVAAIHEQGGLAIPAHPLVPIPMSASARSLRALIDDPDPAARIDGLEVFNPTTAGRRWHPRVVAFAAAHGLAGLGSSDAHLPAHIGQASTRFEGRTADDLRRAIEARATTWEGEFYPSMAQVGMLGRQVRKYVRDVRDEVRGKLLRDGTGRDLGYPGGRRRPARYDGDASS